MTSFIVAIVTLSILSGVAFCPSQSTVEEYTVEERISMVNAAVEVVCKKEESLKNFIQCEMTPGISQGGSFNPRSIHTDFGMRAGVIFATAKPSPLVVRPSDRKFIWKVTKEVKGSKQKPEIKQIPVDNEIKVALKFRFKQNDTLRIKEEENLQTLNSFGLAPTRYVFGNAGGPIMTHFIVMDRVDGVSFLEYLIMAKSSQGMDRYDADTKLRIPGLRLLYVYMETMLLLKRLHIEHKWRHCDLRMDNVMVRESTNKEVAELAERLRKEEQLNSRTLGAHQQAWIALHFEARSMMVKKDDKKSFYLTDNSHMLFIDTEMAEKVDPARQKDPKYIVCGGLSDIATILSDWDEMRIQSNPHATQVRAALYEIFAPLTGRQLSAPVEEKVLKTVIKQLKMLEEKEKEDFMADYKEAKVENEAAQLAAEMLFERLSRQAQGQFEPQYTGSGKAKRTERRATGSLEDLRNQRVSQQTGFKPTFRSASQPTGSLQSLSSASTDNVSNGNRAPPSFPESSIIKGGILKKATFPKRKQRLQEPLSVTWRNTIFQEWPDFPSITVGSDPGESFPRYTSYPRPRRLKKNWEAEDII